MSNVNQTAEDKIKLLFTEKLLHLKNAISEFENTKNYKKVESLTHELIAAAAYFKKQTLLSKCKDLDMYLKNKGNDTAKISDLINELKKEIYQRLK